MGASAAHLIALVPLILWFVLSMLVYSRADYETLRHWLGNPINAGLLVTLLVTAFYHANRHAGHLRRLCPAGVAQVHPAAG